VLLPEREAICDEAISVTKTNVYLFQHLISVTLMQVIRVDGQNGRGTDYIESA
jgi:hypothetical protein